MHTKKNRIIFATLSIFALSTILLIPFGCGGGGDGDGTPADTTAPTVVSVSPSSDGTDIATNTSISVTFSEDMDPSTVNEGTITVSSSSGTLSASDDGPSSRNVTGTVSYANMIATFTPAADLAFATTFTVTVTTGVTDLAGNALAAAYVFMFSTGLEPDTTPPTVTGTTPDDGDEDLDLDTVVSATFSEPVDPSTLTSDNIEVRVRGYDLTELFYDTMGAFVLDTAGTTISFEPSDGLPRNAEYEVVLGTGITDMAGNPLASEFSWSFSTRPGAWGDPVQLYEADDDDPEHPQVGFDGSGRAHVLWSGGGEDIGGDYAYYAYSRRYNASKETVWGSKKTRTSVVGSWGSHTNPIVASNRVGTTVGVWRITDEDVYELFGSVFDGSWGDETQLSVYEETDSPYEVSVTVDVLGNALAGWYSYYDPDDEGPLESDAQTVVNWYSADNRAGTWGGAENISIDEGPGGAPPALAFDPDGNAVAVFENYTDYKMRARLAESGGGWSSTIMIISSDDLMYAEYPDIGADGNGNAVAVYQGHDGENYMICANRYEEGTGDNWDDSTEVVISNTDPYPNYCSEPDIAVDFTSGDAVAVWKEDWETSDFVVANLYDAESDTWKTPRDIATDTGVYPKVACDFAGNFFIYWYYEGTLYARTYRLGDQWSTSSFSDPQAVAEGLSGLGGNDVHLGVGPNGRAIMTWKDGYTIQANVFE